MVFNSLDFIFFFLVFYPVFLIIPGNFKWVWLLASSWFFYASFKPEYIIVLLFLTLADYFCGREIAKRDGLDKKFFLIAALSCNVGVLFVFKYLGFFAGISGALTGFNPLANFSLILPIGISFHTFQGMAYAIDIYRGKIPFERHFGIFALYISIFPQLVAGPIERAQNLIPQLKKPFSLAPEKFREALFLILAGYIKKIAIADNLGVVVDAVYGSPGDFGGSTLVLATVFFAFQLYCDFSGYVDIARGLAKLLGVDFVINFNKPYFSSDISDFWRRWHISLSSWVRDYLYIPLGGNRKGLRRQIVNLAATMTIMGLWHGANFTFAVWGIYHGFLLALHKIIMVARKGLNFSFAAPRAVGIAVTFALVNLGWVFFRSQTIHEALAVLGKIFSPSLLQAPQYSSGMLFGAWLIAGLVFLEALDAKFELKSAAVKANPAVFAFVCAAMFYALIFFGAKDTANFIYSQF